MNLSRPPADSGAVAGDAACAAVSVGLEVVRNARGNRDTVPVRHRATTSFVDADAFEQLRARDSSPPAKYPFSTGPCPDLCPCPCGKLDSALSRVGFDLAGFDELADHLIRQIRIHGGRAIARSGRRVMRVAHGAVSTTMLRCKPGRQRSAHGAPRRSRTAHDRQPILGKVAVGQHQNHLAGFTASTRVRSAPSARLPARCRRVVMQVERGRANAASFRFKACRKLPSTAAGCALPPGVRAPGFPRTGCARAESGVERIRSPRDRVDRGVVTCANCWRR